VSVSTGWPHIKTQPSSRKKYHAKEVTLFASHLVLPPRIGNLGRYPIWCCKHHSGGLATGAGLANMRKTSKKLLLKKNDQDVDDHG